MPPLADPGTRVASDRALFGPPAAAGVAAALVVGLFLAAWSWSRVFGYELADIVEFLDRAEAFVRGEALDPNSVRSFAFSALLSPLFALTHGLGLPGSVAVVMARVLMIALSLATIVVVARTAARLAGPAMAPGAAAVGAAFLLAANPVFAQYAAAPLAGTAAAFFVAIGVELGTRDPTLRRALGAGAAFGTAIVFAYQCLPIVVPLALAIAMQPLWRRPANVAALGAGGAVLVAANGWIDLVATGRFARSLESYLSQNVYGTLAGNLYRLGLETPARWLYARISQADLGAEQRQQLPRDWYVTQLDDRCLVWPAIGLVVIGVAFALRRRSWLPLAMVGVIAVNVWLMSAKGSKSFRLWMPMLPAIAVLGGLGAAALWGTARSSAVRRVGLVAMLAAVVALSPRVLARVNFERHGAYWEAVTVLARDLAADDRPIARFASAYHWAVRFRDARGLELVKLPYHLDRWKHLEPEQRDELIDAVAGLDGFIGHLQSFSQDPRLMAVVNERFEVSRVIDHGPRMEDLEPVFVLRRRTGAPGARTFFEVITLDPDGADAYGARIQYPMQVDFRRREEDGTLRQIVFLGYDIDLGVCDAGQPWITLHWRAGPGLADKDYTLVDRWTDGLGRGWNHNHRPGHGAWPTSRWAPGEVFRESFLATWPVDPAKFGGAYARGAVLPVGLWLAVVEYDENEVQVGGLAVSRLSGTGTMARRGWGEGRRWSSDGLVAAGGFWWPIPPDRRRPDDGRMFAGER